MTAPVDLAALLVIDPDAHRAPFEQLRLGVIGLIADGKLLAGSRIPTVRALAADLGLAPNTVAKTYRELEAAGVIESRGRSGSFVKAGPDARLATAQRAAVDYLKTLRDLGIDDQTALNLVRQATTQT